MDLYAALCPDWGNTVIDWIAYGHVIQTSKDKSKFGKGDIRGVIAPESANNAKEGGALIPTILFGIPGSGAMAILLGGFILIGIEPGLNMINEDLDLVFIMFWSVAVANIMGAGICLIFSNQLAKVTTVKNTILAPLVLVLIFFAAFQITRDWADLIALLICGSLGIYMKRFGWSRPGLLIGFVLSGKVEASIYQTVQVYGFSFLERPIVIILILFTIFSVIAAARFKPQVGQTVGERPPLPQGYRASDHLLSDYCSVQHLCAGRWIFPRFPDRDIPHDHRHPHPAFNGTGRHTNVDLKKAAHRVFTIRSARSLMM